MLPIVQYKNIDNVMNRPGRKVSLKLNAPHKNHISMLAIKVEKANQAKNNSLLNAICFAIPQ